MPDKRVFAIIREASMLKSGLMAVALTLTVLSPISKARADGFELFPGVGVYLGYNFGGENSGIAWGLEAYADIWSSSSCRSTGKTGIFFGPNFRFGFVNFGSPQITFGGRGGVTSGVLSVAAEAGVTYQFYDNAGAGFNLGLHSMFTLGGLRANYLFGLPGDSIETMQKTLNLSMELCTIAWNAYAVMALPGSKMYKTAIEKGFKLPEDYAGYSFHSYNTQPLPTDQVSASEILKFRDNAFFKYHSHQPFLENN